MKPWEILFVFLLQALSCVCYLNYHLTSAQIKWGESNQLCQSLGLNLETINTPYKSERIQTFLQSNTTWNGRTKDTVYFGLRYYDDEWVHTKLSKGLVWSNWATDSGDPAVKQKCAYIKPPDYSYWYFGDCWRTYYALCEGSSREATLKTVYYDHVITSPEPSSTVNLKNADRKWCMMYCLTIVDECNFVSYSPGSCQIYDFYFNLTESSIIKTQFTGGVIMQVVG